MTHRTMSERSYHGATSRSRWLNEGNVLFNDTLNTFYLRLYGVGDGLMNGTELNQLGFFCNLLCKI